MFNAHRNRIRPARRAALAGLALLGLPVASGAQQLSLKRAVPEPAPGGCEAQAAAPVPARPPAEQREQAVRLLTAGTQAAIVGDHAAARDLLERAARLDPTAENVAYHLARAREELGERAQAVREFCRYLVLAPGAPDAAEVRGRIAELAPPQEAPYSAEALRRFREGLDAFDGDRLAEAEVAFTMALAEAPEWADAYYNRGLVYAARGRRDPAGADLRRYLELNPEAEDRTAVLASLATLQPPPRRYSPAAALVSGTMLPGMGQFYTRRPVVGILVLAAVGGAAYYGLNPVEVTETREFTDPFGNVRRYEAVILERQNLHVGLGAAAGVVLLGAVEAFLYARRARREPPPLPARGESAAPDRRSRGPRLALPAVSAGADGLRLGVVRIVH